MRREGNISRGELRLGRWRKPGRVGGGCAEQYVPTVSPALISGWKAVVRFGYGLLPASAPNVIDNEAAYDARSAGQRSGTPGGMWRGPLPPSLTVSARGIIFGVRVTDLPTCPYFLQDGHSLLGAVVFHIHRSIWPIIGRNIRVGQHHRTRAPQLEGNSIKLIGIDVILRIPEYQLLNNPEEEEEVEENSSGRFNLRMLKWIPTEWDFGGRGKTKVKLWAMWDECHQLKRNDWRNCETSAARRWNGSVASINSMMQRPISRCWNKSAKKVG